MKEDVRYWFEQAIDVAAEGRAAFLQSACDNTAVRVEVLSLLDHDSEDAGAPLEAVRNVMGTVLVADAAPARRVGPYRLGKLLGSGGMGFVHEAHRDDGAVSQRVAVKFAQVPPTASEKIRERAHRRFVRERQVLASLRHPYIAGLIDAGTTEEGIPYAVLEQVDGVPIDAYCDSWLPEDADRVRLVLKLCDAVQFAHRNLIVHSDIKPDNVLVTADGIPKLIDFGIATDLSGDRTLSTTRAFTPGYASPEQCRGFAPTVATDVYGLAAVLYRLLTGASPRELKSESLEEVIRSISDEDVLRPSAIRPDLKGDLENILLKALQREPHRRYGSVPEFADDLNRFLARRPVRASPDSALYRARRFVRRHWVPLAATGTLVAALTAATVVSLREREAAMARAAETRRLADRLLFEVHDEIRGVIGGTRARERLGDIAVQYLEGLERDYGRDPELAWELLNAYSRLAQSRGGSASSVGETMSGSNFAAKTLALGAVVESGSPDAKRRDALFSMYEGMVGIFLEAGRSSEAQQTIDRMLQLSADLHPVREAQALKQLARFLDSRHQPQRAAAAWARALRVLRSVSGTPDAPAETGAHLVSTLVGFGRAQSLAGDFAGGVASLQEAIRLTESRSVAQPQMARTARQLYWSYIQLGDTLGSPLRFNLGRPLQAAEHYQKAQKIAMRLVNADPANEMARLDLSRALSREGGAMAALDPARALDLLKRAQRVAAETSSGNHSGLISRFDYLTAAVDPLVRMQRLDQARAYLSETRTLAAQMRKDGVRVDETSLLKAEAICAYGEGRTREALVYAQQQLDLMPKETRPVLSENHATVELLDRMRTYAAGLDSDIYAAATARLVRIWSDLRSAYPESEFVRAQAERVKS